MYINRSNTGDLLFLLPFARVQSCLKQLPANCDAFVLTTETYHLWNFHPDHCQAVFAALEETESGTILAKPVANDPPSFDKAINETRQSNSRRTKVVCNDIQTQVKASIFLKLVETAFGEVR